MCLLFLQIFLNYLGNYIPNQWNKENGCVHCSQDNIELPSDRDTWPTVFLALFVETPTPFLPQVLEKIQRLDYPTQRMSVWIHNQVCVCNQFLNITALNMKLY